MILLRLFSVPKRSIYAIYFGDRDIDIANYADVNIQYVFFLDLNFVILNFRKILKHILDGFIAKKNNTKY